MSMKSFQLSKDWLINGNLHSKILSDDFEFTSPFWKSSHKTQFIAKFLDPTEYRETSLSNIIKFDPVIRLKSDDGKYFTIVLQYHTKNAHSVYEGVLGEIENGLLIKLRSIYDLQETKKAHGL